MLKFSDKDFKVAIIKLLKQGTIDSLERKLKTENFSKEIKVHRTS